MLRKTVYLCVLIGIGVLVFRASDLSAGARDFIQDRLTELGITLQN